MFVKLTQAKGNRIFANTACAAAATGEVVRLKHYRARRDIIITLFLGVVFPIVGSVVVQILLPQLRLIQEPLHSSLEAIGALIALVLALLLLVIKRHRKDLSHYVWISSALIGMGIIDGFHAGSLLGGTFVWLRSVATLFGGFLFVMVWLPKHVTQSRPARITPGAVTVTAIIISLFSLAFPGALPVMVSRGAFTPTASIINVLGGVFFYAAAARFLARYVGNNGTDELAFANLCLFFGSAGLLFRFSQLWEANWWFWHVLRLIGYFIALLYVFILFQREEEEIRKLNADLAERIDERKRAMELSDALNGINAAISSTFNVNEIMQRVIVESAKALGAETAAILLHEDDHWVAKYIYGFPQEQAGTRFSDEEARIATLSVRARKAIAIDDAYNDRRVNGESVRRYGIRSFINAPLAIKGDTIGILAFYYLKAPIAFTEAQIDFANKLAASVSLSLENAQLYANERNIADTLQEALLTVPHKIDGISFGYLYRSATETARVGGDFYDVFELEHDKVGLVIGDVSGKGLEAATLTALVKNTIKAYAYELESPALILARTNDVVRKTLNPALFITVFVGMLDMKTGILTYCSAGHPPAIFKRKTANTQLLVTSSPMIGAFAGLEYVDDAIALSKSDILVLYTDGVVEARHIGGFFGTERLVKSIQELESVSAEDIPRAIFDIVVDYAEGKLSDDIAILAISLKSEPNR